MAVTYCSTRGSGQGTRLSAAISAGLAPDGGLFVPASMPAPDMTQPCDPRSLPSVARVALKGFFSGDGLEQHLGSIADAALSIEAPTTDVAGLGDPLHVLELYHGPTAAFKDFGARFLAECHQRLQPADAGPTTILVATSGDTGGAVAAAFHRRPWARVVVLFPKGLVSPRQEKQLTCWGENVRALRVRGTFDDCQRMVKEAFLDSALRRFRLSSANSINIGRLLPQVVYYAASSLELFRRTGEKPSYIVPSGNLGNVTAALWARTLGFPIARLILAHNANRTVPDFLKSGQWQSRPSIATLASAMDVGSPSNIERLRALFPEISQLREQISADWVDDASIKARIQDDFKALGRIWCPHTATAAELYRRLPPAQRRRPWVLVATAHPAKFNDVVEPLIGRSIGIPPSLARLLDLPSQCLDVPPTMTALADALA